MLVQDTAFTQGLARCSGDVCIATGGGLSFISASPADVTGAAFHSNGAVCEGSACQATGGGVASLNYAGGVPSVNVSLSVSHSLFNASFARFLMRTTTPNTTPTAPAGVFGALGGAYFVQTIVPPTSPTLRTSTLNISRTRHVNSTVACSTAGGGGGGGGCQAAGGVGFVLTYSGTSTLHADACDFSDSNATCRGAPSCHAGWPLFDGAGGGGAAVTGSIGESPCSVVDNGAPNEWPSRSAYLAHLEAPGVPIDSGGCSVRLTCGFLSQLDWRSAGTSSSTFNASCVSGAP